jgi:predicted phosphodiesterase
MRRIALYSDIHGNLPALEAVLADIDGSGITERYCLGDLVGYGPDPSGVIARVRATGDPVIRGNYDDGVGGRKGGCGCYYGTPEARSDGDASYAFTDGALNNDEHAYLAGLVDDLRLETAGVRVLLCHGSPRRINEYLMPDRPDGNLAKLADIGEADVVCVGHIHVPYHRVVTADDGRAVHYVSDGSVGRPKDGDPRACWAELVLGTKAEVNKRCEGDRAAGPVGASGAGDRVWLGVVFHRVEYDVESVAAAIVAVGLPERLAEALRTG